MKALHRDSSSTFQKLLQRVLSKLLLKFQTIFTELKPIHYYENRLSHYPDKEKKKQQILSEFLQLKIGVSLFLLFILDNAEYLFFA